MKSFQIPANGSWWIVQVLPTDPHFFESDALRGERSGILENLLEFPAQRRGFWEIAFVGWT